MDQLIRGLLDKEIVSDLLGDAKTDMTLQETVDYVARKEQAKTEQVTISCEQTSAAQQTPVKGYTCWACQGNSHTNRQRKDKCPAWGSQCTKCSGRNHYTSCCPRCSECQTWGHRDS